MRSRQGAGSTPCFKVDSKFDDMEPGARKAARDAELRPLMEDFGGMGAGQLPLASVLLQCLFDRFGSVFP